MSKKCVAFSKSKLGLEKPDNKKAFYAGWDAALSEQAEQEPVAKVVLNRANQITIQKPNGDYFDVSKHVGQNFYAAPVRTKDLTDDELCDVIRKADVTSALELYRAVIAADREKNK